MLISNTIPTRGLIFPSKIRSTLPDGSSLFEKTRSKKRRPFTEEEDRALKAGYEKHGTIWATIVKDPIFKEQGRRSTDLRDRFRNAFPELYQAAGYKPRNAAESSFLQIGPDYADWEPEHIPEDECGKYVATTFEQAAHDFANGCRTLDTVTVGNMVGELLIEHGLSARIIRETEGGPAREVRRTRAWGNIIGREEEW